MSEQHKGIIFDRIDPSVKKGKNYLLAIGINDYVHCPKLYNAVKDVRDFIGLMTSKYQFEEENITILLDEEATSRQIVKDFRKLAQKITVDDNIIIYFSGHGEFDKVLQQGYWIPVDAEKGEFDDYLPNSTILDVLNAISSRHTFLIADSCFSGSLFSSRDANRDISSRLETEPSRWGLTSGRNEIVSDGEPNKNSPFAGKLLDLLSKNEKPLGAAELCAKMMEIVAANAKQTPRGEPLKIKGHDGGQFFFHLKNNEQEDWEATLAKHSIEGFQKFMEKYPFSNHAVEVQVLVKKMQKEANDKVEKRAYDQAKQVNSVASLAKFLQKYPLSTYASEVEELLSELEEEVDWSEAKNRDTISIYRDFLRKHPQSNFVDECNKRIEKKIQRLDDGERTRLEELNKRTNKPVKQVVPKVSSQTSNANEPPFYQKFKVEIFIALIILVGLGLWKIPDWNNSQPLNLSPHTSTQTPPINELQKPVFDQQKFENLLKDADGALEASDKSDAKKAIEEAKQMSPNDARINDLENRLKKLK